MLLLCLAFEAGFVTDTFEIRKDPVQDVLTLDGKVDCACSCDELMFTFLCSVLLHSHKRVSGTKKIERERERLFLAFLRYQETVQDSLGRFALDGTPVQFLGHGPHCSHASQYIFD
jgi:hypothetical protein